MKLGVIQGVEVYDDYSASWDFGATIWFVGEHHVRNVERRKLKQLNCRVASHLLNEGYSIKVPSLFDAKLQKLLESE